MLPAPKVQAAFERDKKSVYPPEGRKAFAVTVGQRHELRFAIRGTLVNVWIDGEFMHCLIGIRTDAKASSVFQDLMRPLISIRSRSKT